MIPIEKERQALRLLATGRLSRRQIAAAVGISRGTVGVLKRIGQERARPVKDRTMGRTDRCPGCGRLIELPCLACQAEAHREMSRARKFPSTPATEADLAPDLDDEQQARLDLFRARKIAQGETPRDDKGEEATLTMPATISMESGIKHLDIRCVCGFGLTAWVVGSGPIFYRRPGPPREPVRLAACPNCRRSWPRMSGDEFLDAIAG